MCGWFAKKLGAHEFQVFKILLRKSIMCPPVLKYSFVVPQFVFVSASCFGHQPPITVYCTVHIAIQIQYIHVLYSNLAGQCFSST